MAQKRMFTMRIVDSDAFLDMPLSTQCLYFHLNMRADDDGFIGNPKKIMRMIGASEDDLKILLAKKFLLIFDNSVVVVKHWWMHNTLAKDRYHETSYTDEKAMLGIKENKAYTLDKSETLKICNQNVNGMLTECNLNVNSDLDLDLGLDKDKELTSVCFSGEQKKLNITKEDYQQFLKDSFSLITCHNTKHKNKIGISNSYTSYMQKEGRAFIQLLNDIDLEDLLNALRNYISVTEQETWKTYFGFNDFIKNYVDYIPSNFEISKFVSVPKSENEIYDITQTFAEKNMNEKWFDYAIFHHHRADWIKAGKPEGESFEKWADAVYEEDNQNGKLDSDGCYI